jgi:hypothetical protein
VCKGAISLPSYHSILCILTVDERGTKEETYVQDKNIWSYGMVLFTEKNNTSSDIVTCYIRPEKLKVHIYTLLHTYKTENLTL